MYSPQGRVGRGHGEYTQRVGRYGKIALLLMLLIVLAGFVFVRSSAYRQMMIFLQDWLGKSFDVHSILPPPELLCQEVEVVAEATVVDVETPRFNRRLGLIPLRLPFEENGDPLRIYTPIRLEVDRYIRSTENLSTTDGYLVSYEPHDSMNLLVKGQHGIVFLNSEVLTTIAPDDFSPWHKYLYERARTMTQHDVQLRPAVVVQSFRADADMTVDGWSEEQYDSSELLRRIESACGSSNN